MLNTKTRVSVRARSRSGSQAARRRRAVRIANSHFKAPAAWQSLHQIVTQRILPMVIEAHARNRAARLALGLPLYWEDRS